MGTLEFFGPRSADGSDSVGRTEVKQATESNNFLDAELITSVINWGLKTTQVVIDAADELRSAAIELKDDTGLWIFKMRNLGEQSVDCLKALGNLGCALLLLVTAFVEATLRGVLLPFLLE